MFDPRAKDLNCERSLKDERFFNLSMLLSYVHHILTRHLRPSSVVRKYIRYYAAYVTRPHELTFSGHVVNQFWIKPHAGTKIESALIK